MNKTITLEGVHKGSYDVNIHTGLENTTNLSIFKNYHHFVLWNTNVYSQTQLKCYIYLRCLIRVWRWVGAAFHCQTITLTTHQTANNDGGKKWFYVQ